MSEQPPQEPTPPGPVPPAPVPPAPVPPAPVPPAPTPPPPPQNPYQPYAGQAGVPGWAPDHPQATTVLILGILGMSLCQLVAPFAWVIGGRAKREIDANPGHYGGRQQVQVGYVLGVVGTCLLGLYAFFGLAYLAIVIVAVASGA